MAKLPKFTLSHNEEKSRWDLNKDKSDQTIKSFENKSDALKTGVLKKAVGGEGGSVKIKKTDGKIQQERTYPRKADPERSKG